MQLRPFYKFILMALLCYVVWFILYDLWLKPGMELDDFLGTSTAWFSIKIMDWAGFDLSYRSVDHLHYFYNNSERILQMVPACNGQVLYALYSGFIISTPGKLKHKALAIGGGMAIIFILNACRVAALCYIKMVMPQYLAFNHKYTFIVIIYGCIFALWMIWINYFVPKSLPQNESSTH